MAPVNECWWIYAKSCAISNLVEDVRIWLKGKVVRTWQTRMASTKAAMEAMPCWRWMRKRCEQLLTRQLRTNPARFATQRNSVDLGWFEPRRMGRAENAIGRCKKTSPTSQMPVARLEGGRVHGLGPARRIGKSCKPQVRWVEQAIERCSCRTRVNQQ